MVHLRQILSTSAKRFTMALAIGLSFLLIHNTGAAAEPLPVPAGSVVLRIKGALNNPNIDNEVHLDLATLKSLPTTTIQTRTPWSEGTQSFTGVRLNELFKAIDAQSANFVAVGLDDYKFTFQDIDIEKYPVIIAYLHNEKPMSVRQLGPLRIMFPFNDYPELLTPKNESSSVWQLLEIELL